MSRISPLLIAACLAAAPVLAHAEVVVSLRGSRASMVRQNRIARAEDYSFLRTPAQVRSFVDDGRLDVLAGNDDYEVIASYPYARPVVRMFVERLSSRYREACGERLVVTSLTRPASRQPRNASPLSVHPAGMAVDLRVSADDHCRGWLADELLELEELGLIDATREKRPPHFHVAVFPAPFEEYDAAQRAADEAAAEAERLRLAELVAQQQLAAAALPDAPTGAPARVAPNLLLALAALVSLLFLPMVA